MLSLRGACAPYGDPPFKRRAKFVPSLRDVAPPNPCCRLLPLSINALHFGDRGHKKSLTNVCLSEIMKPGLDSGLAGRWGMRKAEGGKRNAECGVRNAGPLYRWRLAGRPPAGSPGAYRRPPQRTGPAGGTHGKPGQAPAVQEIGTRLASSLPYYTSYLMVIGRQGACSCESAGCRKRDPDRTHFHGPQLRTSKGLALHHLCKDKGVRSAEFGVRNAQCTKAITPWCLGGLVVDFQAHDSTHIPWGGGNHRPRN